MINLHYLEEVGQGNKAFEKEVTGQFVEVMPVALAEMQHSLEQKKIKIHFLFILFLILMKLNLMILNFQLLQKILISFLLEMKNIIMMILK
jgi:hypothetical protein